MGYLGFFSFLFITRTANQLGGHVTSALGLANTVHVITEKYVRNAAQRTKNRRLYCMRKKKKGKIYLDGGGTFCVP